MSRFRSEILSELNAVATKVNRAMENTAVQGLSFITARAVVDSGRYRAGWNLSVDKPMNMSPTFKRKPKGHKKRTDIYGLKPQHILFDITRNNSVVLSNNVEYAQKVDAKYADVARTKMVMLIALQKRFKAIK